MSNNPFFSIVLPTYNVSKYIDRCIASLLNQTFHSFEAIFVDDVSQDNSSKIVSSCKDPRIKIIYHEKNKGTFQARKSGYMLAKGVYTIFLDPDDELESTFLEHLFNLLEKRKSDLIFFDMKVIPKEKWYEPKLRLLPYKQNTSVIQAIYKKGGKNTVWAGIAGKAYHTKFLKKVYDSIEVDKNFRHVYTEDKLLFYSALLLKPSYIITEKKGYIYHKNLESITQQKDDASLINLVNQIDFTTKVLKKNVRINNLTSKEKDFFDFALNKSSEAQKQLILRHVNNSEFYLNHVLTSFLTIPHYKQIIRILIYIITFRKIKL